MPFTDEYGVPLTGPGAGMTGQQYLTYSEQAAPRIPGTNYFDSRAMEATQRVGGYAQGMPIADYIGPADNPNLSQVIDPSKVFVVNGESYVPREYVRAPKSDPFAKYGGAVLGAAGMMMGLPPTWAGALGGATGGAAISDNPLTGAIKGGLLGAGAGYLGGQIFGAGSPTLDASGLPVDFAASDIGLSSAAQEEMARLTAQAGAESATQGALGSVIGAGTSLADLPAMQELMASGMSQAEAASAIAGTGANTGMLSQIGGFISKPLIGNITGGNLLSTGANLLGGYLQGKSATEAAQTSADAQLRAAQIAADAAKFRPIGVTTRFGKSQFGYDANGNLISAGYALAPDVLAQQNQLMGATGGLLNQYTGAQQATAPMGQAAQSMMTLGQGYLGISPQEQAAKYMAEQQALLAGPRAAEYARMQQQLQNTGRAGLSMGGGGGMTAANPEMQAYYNALNQQNLALAAQATQGGMDYSKFGAGMVGSGGEMLKGMYGTQQAAYAPYQTMLGGATGLEQLGQQAMNIGTELGRRTTAATAAGGTILGQGMLGAAQTMQPTNAYSPWGALLTGTGQAIGQYGQPTQAPYAYDPNTGKPVVWR